MVTHKEKRKRRPETCKTHNPSTHKQAEPNLRELRAAALRSSLRAALESIAPLRGLSCLTHDENDHKTQIM